MRLYFEYQTADDGIRVTLFDKKLLGAKKILPFSQWATIIDKTAWRPINAFLEQERAAADGESLLIPHKTVSSLPQVLCACFNLPELARVSVALQFNGRIDSSDGHLCLEWHDENSRVVRPTRRGAIVQIGGESWRLSPLFFELCGAVEGFNATRGQRGDQRISSWSAVRDALDRGIGRNIKADGYAQSLYFFQAGAFSLDIFESADGPDFKPILMRRVEAPLTDDEAPAEEIGSDENSGTKVLAAEAVLPEEKQRTFLRSFEEQSGGARDAYVLGKNAYVIVAPDLKIALDVVREKRRAPLEERRAFLRNPRSAIADALESHRRDIASLFVETKNYSDRVDGLGVWQDISLPPNPHNGGWLPEGFPDTGSRKFVTPENVNDMAARVEEAEANGADQVEVGGEQIPLSELKVEIERVREAVSQNTPAPAADSQALSGDTGEPPKRQNLGLVIKMNIDGVEYETQKRPRKPLIPCEFPVAQMSSNQPKDHQREGFKWLVDAWCTGWPGVLLADDMGLGKTYQALAFLAWMRGNRKALGGRRSQRLYPASAALGPILIVAPTSLLRNWLEEAERHLASGGMGICVEAFGSKLRSIRQPGKPPEEALDIGALNGADWILTTYETLADYHRAFARVPYSVVVFDEMQKIKNPNSINTRSAGTLNIDFVLGLTGTPIENRIEDLWCLFDRLAPGYLGALRDFSSRYSGESRERLSELKNRIDRPVGDCPPPLLRRMKDQARDGLKNKEIKTYQVRMPELQAKEYERVVASAAGADGSRNQMLKVLHAMRGVSLHPRAKEVDPADRRSAQDWIKGSARLSKAFEILCELSGRGEKAIVFVEDLGVQAAFGEAVTTLLDLDRIPDVINGSVPGDRRQDIVKRFQNRGPGFDFLMLSPKAAGVGLTITAATHVIHLSRWWNPAVEDQCNDRAYRIGQTRDVTIHVPMAIHPAYGDESFDAKLDQLLTQKRDLSRDMLIPSELDSDLSNLFSDVTRTETAK